MKKSITLLIVALFLSGLFAVPREMVIVEIATGTWCGYCPGAAMGAHDLLANGHNVAVIKNHNGDAFANTYSNARNNYYPAIEVYPTAIFDGVLNVGGGSANQSLYSNYLSRVNQRLAVPSNFTITAAGELIGSELTVAVTVTKVSDDSHTNIRLRSSITESNIAFNWFNQTSVDNVNRLMAPNATGVPINLATGESVTETLVFSLNSSWELPNLELVLFLQSDTDKEILQGKKYSIPGISGATPVSTTSLLYDGTYVGGSESLPITFYNFFDTPVMATLTSSSPHFMPEYPNITIQGSRSLTMNINFIPMEEGDFTGTITVSGNFHMHPEISINVSGSSFINSPPLAQDVMLTGAPIVYENLSGSYTFTDPDQDAEGDSEMRWYRYNDGVYSPIAGQTSNSYRIAEADIGHRIAFGVTPVDMHGMPGETVYSTPSDPIINIPAPQNFEGVLEPPSTVILTWEQPPFYGDRGFVGYKIFRNGLNISTITNTNTLTFSDTWVPEGNHEYWICTLFNNPVAMSDPSPSIFIKVGDVSNEDAVSNAQFAISTSPNPFAGSMSFFAKALPISDATISVYNLKGQIVNRFDLKTDINGEASFFWDGKDKNGRELESGVYLYKMESSGKNVSGKMIKIK